MSSRQPDLAGMAGRAKNGIEGADGGEENHGEVDRIGEEEIGEGGGNQFQVEDEEQGQKEGGR